MTRTGIHMNDTKLSPAPATKEAPRPADESETPELIIYQIGGDERRDSATPYRYVVTVGFDDAGVGAQLEPGEFIDTTSTLSGTLGGDVAILPLHDLATLLRAAYHALRGYQYGNASHELAESIADRIAATVEVKF